MRIKIVRLQGGLGNLLFQLGWGWYLNASTGAIVKYDRLGVPDETLVKARAICDVDDDKFVGRFERTRNTGLLPVHAGIIRQLTVLNVFPHIVHQRMFDSLPSLEASYRGRYFSGYFQHEKIARIVLSHISPDFLRSQKRWQKKLASQFGTKIVAAVHVRLGDYLNKQQLNVHGQLGADYYQRSIRAVSEFYAARGEQPVFLVFSNSPSQAIELVESYELPVIAKSFSSFWHADDIDELTAMSVCHANIVANSTFSFWATRLNPYSELKIAPVQWFAQKGLNFKADQLFDGDWHRC